MLIVVFRIAPRLGYLIEEQGMTYMVDMDA